MMQHVVFHAEGVEVRISVALPDTWTADQVKRFVEQTKRTAQYTAGWALDNRDHPQTADVVAHVIQRATDLFTQRVEIPEGEFSDAA